MFGDDFGKYPFNVEGYTLYDFLRILVYWKLPNKDLKQRLVLMLRKKRRYRHDAIIYEKACSEIEAIKWEEVQHFRTRTRNWIGDQSKSTLEEESEEEDELAKQKIILERLENKVEELKTFNEQSQTENVNARNILFLILIVIVLLLSLQSYYNY